MHLMRYEVEGVSEVKENSFTAWLQQTRMSSSFGAKKRVQKFPWKVGEEPRNFLGSATRVNL